MTLPFLIKAVRLQRDEGFKRVEIRYDECNIPYIVGFIDPDGEDNSMAARIDRA